MDHSHRRSRFRPGLAIAAGVVSFAFIAAACGDDSTSTNTTAAATTAKPADTTAKPADTTAKPADTTAAPDTTAKPTDTTAVETTAAPTTAAGEKPTPGGTLRVRVEADTNGWVPQIMQCDSACQFRARTFFEPLLALDQNNKVTGYLAESYSVDPTYTKHTLKIRPGVTFHDGTKLDAAAVVKNLQLAAVTGFNGQALSDIQGGGPGQDPSKVGVKAVDDMTVEITTSRPWVDLPYYLTSSPGLIASPAWLAKVFADPAKPDAVVGAQPVGTGPFVFGSWKPGDTLVVKKNPNYWRKAANGDTLPYLDEVDFKVIADSLTAKSALEGGQIDLMPDDNGQNLKAFSSDSKYKYIEQKEYGETFYDLLNVGQAGSPLEDQRVRCGLAAATDPKTLNEATAAGYLPIANGPFSPGQPGHLDDTGNQQYDPEKAKQLIADYTKEKGKPKIIFSTVPDQTALDSANLLAQWWGDAGVDVQVVQIEQQKLILNALLGDPQFNAFGWRNHGGLTLDQQYIWWHSKYASPPGQVALNFGRLKDPVIDQLLDQNRGEADPAKKQAIAEAVNKEFAKQCWIIPTLWTIWGITSGQNVNGVGKADAPAGGYLRDGAGFPGQVWLTNTWLKQ